MKQDLKTKLSASLGPIKRILGLRAADISDRFFNIILVSFTFLLFTQLFYIIFFEANRLNTIITVVSFVLFLSITILVVKSPPKPFVKWAFLFVVHLVLAFFWFTAEGLQGSLNATITVCVFVVAITVPDKHSAMAVSLSFVFYFLLAISEFFFPALIVPYNNVTSKKIDILVSIIFNSLLVGFSFVYLKGEYEKKVEEERVQKEQQKQLNEELDNFVYRTSHDLRAPIASSLGLLDLIEQTDNPEERGRYLALQRRSLLKLDDFIKEILNYSRNTRLELTQSAINFRQIIDDEIAQLQFSQPEKQLNISIDCPDNLIFYSDKIRLQIIFKNLISNAFRYCDKNKAECFLHIQIREKEDELVVVFEDNGVGIQKEYIPKIFDMFFRANTSYAGSGVGLYIVKQTLQKLGGSIFCDSELGKGTTFKIYLPKRQLSD